MAAKCRSAPIDRCRPAGDAAVMTHSFMSLTDDAPAAAAGRPSDDGSLDAITSLLVELEEALRAMSTATQDAAHSLIPPGRIDESVAERYARAAESWPRRGDGAPPTHERQAELLSAFDDARAALRAASECCRHARQTLASTLHAPGDQPSDLQA